MSASTNWWDDCRKWFLGLPPAAQWARGIGVAVVGLVLIGALTSSSSPQYPQYPANPWVSPPANGGYAPGGYGPTPAQGGVPVVPGLPGPNLNGSYGPFATIRRAEEVVSQFQAMGYRNTIQYHDGDGQYVFPRR